MKNILIDLYPLKENNKNATVGIKYFLSKNNDTHLTIIGESNNLVTLHNNKKITIIQIDTDEIKIKENFKNIKEKNLQLLFTLLSSNEYNSFLTFENISLLKPYIDKYLIRESSPILISSYANYKTHRCTLIGDLGYNLNYKINDYKNYLSLLIDYSNKIIKKENPEFKILTNLIDDKNEIDNVFKDNKNYKGTINVNEIYNADTDILIGNTLTFDIAIKSIDHGITIYDNFIKDLMNKKIGYKLMSPVIKNIIAEFHLEIDNKLISGGMSLLGFNKIAIFSLPNNIPMGIKNSIDLAYKLSK